ncbi:hypothetical protein LOTGIDRAFT_175753 [Lottia gigantea]|uniref:Uncharacterized protein n=1 Tax=Lottia gigantea TaxID=225164 RepID=V4AEF5_LOTGI|nr:hypothetical protein LOTGIDRAFT_175753 [Lottia gigantea]ESO91736.1 hypothetical protein LOTGIDRAFT_175753 [Lottia gigantea]
MGYPVVSSKAIGKHDNKGKVKVLLNGVPLRFIIDSGSSADCLGRDSWEFLKTKEKELDIRWYSEKTDIKLYVYGSEEPLKVLDKFYDNVKLDEKQIKEEEFIVIGGKGEPLLSRETAIKLETVEKPYVRYKRNVTHIKKYYESDRNREIKSETSNKNVFDDISYKVPNQNDHSAIFGNDHTIVPNQNINPDSVSNQSNIDHDDSSDESIKTFNSYQRPKRNRKRPLRYRND